MEQKITVELHSGKEIEVLLPDGRALYLTLEDRSGIPLVQIRDGEGRAVHGLSVGLFAKV